MSDNNVALVVVSAAAGAFLYHMYAKISMIEQAVDGGTHVSLGALLDMAHSKEEDEDKEPPVGFSTTQGKRRRKHV